MIKCIDFFLIQVAFHYRYSINFGESYLEKPHFERVLFHSSRREYSIKNYNANTIKLKVTEKE